MRLPSILSRRPSAPMAVSLLALFLSLGGVGYAAISLPADSVGTEQIRDEAVTYKKIRPNSVGAVRLANKGVTNSKIRDGAVSYKKIQPRSVGRVRANLDQLQARLKSTCPAGSAVGAVDGQGNVTCNHPLQLGAADKTVSVGTSATAVNSVSLPAGASYLVFANPTVTVTGDGNAQHVTCTLSVGTATESRTAALDTTAGRDTTVAVPLQAAGPAGAASVSCSATTTATATAAINALGADAG